MAAIPRYRPHRGPVILSAGFRPFFLLSGLWAAIAIPLWLSVFAGEAVGITSTAQLGNRIGGATLLMLITFVGGRIIPSFTRNWLAKQRPEIPAPATFGSIDRIGLACAAVALAMWVIAPQSIFASWA